MDIGPSVPFEMVPSSESPKWGIERPFNSLGLAKEVVEVNLDVTKLRRKGGPRVANPGSFHHCNWSNPPRSNQPPQHEISWCGKLFSFMIAT